MISDLPNEFVTLINSVLDNKNNNSYFTSLQNDDYCMFSEHYARGIHINGELTSEKGLNRTVLLNFNNNYNIVFFFNNNNTLLSLQISTDGSSTKVPELFYDVKTWSIQHFGEEVEYSKEILFHLTITNPDVADDFEYIYDRILGIKKDTQ